MAQTLACTNPEELGEESIPLFVPSPGDPDLTSRLLERLHKSLKNLPERSFFSLHCNCPILEV